MLALLLSLLLVSSSSTGCEEQYEAVRTRYHAYWTQQSTTLLPLLRAVEAAREACEDGFFEKQQDLYSLQTWALVELRRYDEARGVFDRYFEEVAPRGDAQAVVKMYRRSAFLHVRQGQPVEAMRDYTRASRYTPSLPPDAAAEFYLDMASQYALFKSYETASALLERAAELLVPHLDVHPEYRALLGRVRTKQADHLLSTARTSSSALNLEQVLTYAHEAVQLLDPTDATHEQAFARLILAQALRATGQPAQAAETAEEALQLATAIGAFTLQIPTFETLGLAHQDLGRSEDALTAFRQGLALADEHGEVYYQQRLHTKVGEHLEALGDMEGAEASFRAAIAAAETYRAALGLTEWSTTTFAAQQAPYRALARLLLATGRAEEAFLTLDATRARYLRDVRRMGRSQRLAPPEWQALDRIEAALKNVYADYQDATDPDQRLGLQTEIARLQTERDALLTGGADIPTEPPSLGEIQQALAERDAVLLTYFLGDPSYAFVIRADTFAAVPLSLTTEQLDAALNAISPLWADRDGSILPNRRDTEFDLRALKALHDDLFAPVRALVPAGRPLVVVPEGPLTRLPFGMLVQEPAARFDYTRADYLLRRHPIATELAAALLVEDTPPAEALPVDFLALGRSVFASAPEGTPFRSAAAAELPDLPNVQREIAVLRRLFPGGVFGLDTAASEAFLHRHLPQARVVHLASHATVHPSLPLYSAIHLAPDTTRGEDGVLHLYELSGHDLRAELVVLSGCSTARGQVRTGEGMIGLHYAFRSAGADASMGMLWHINDAAIVEVMERFYTHLRTGLPKDEALRRAQLDYLDRHQGFETSPFHWAAPVLYGDASPVALDTVAARAPWLWAAMGLLLLALGLTLPRLVRYQTRLPLTTAS